MYTQLIFKQSQKNRNMITVDKIDGKDIYQFEIKKNVSKADAEKFYAFLEEHAQDGHKIKILGIINEFPGLKDLKAFGATAKMKMEAIKTVQKYAVLSDRDWAETLLPVGNFLSPGMPMKHFDLDEKDEALAWLEKDADKTYSEDEYLSKMEVEQLKGANIYSFKIDGKIDEAGMTALYGILKDKSREGKINLLATFTDFDGFENFGAFLEGLKVDFAAFGNMEKFAILTNKKWVMKLARLESAILPGISMKGFELHERENALVWLKAGQP